MSVERLLRGQFKEICSCGDSIEVHGEGIWADKLMGILAEWRADHHHHEADGSGDSLGPRDHDDEED